MNNRGALEMKQLFLFIAVVCLCIMISMIMYNKTIKDIFGGAEKSGSTYKDTENKIIKATKEYTFNNRQDLKNGDKDFVTIQTLQNEEILGDVIDPKDKDTICTGYIYFTVKNDDITYDPYIKCGKNYHTKGYNANYDA
ncbi:MAG: hypothetical protein HFH47_02465 [Bacilli bacterium]|nr:hypothetical protein [Bacilli bacterium]